MSHLNLRHNCDYETIANFDLDEEAMLRQAMQASLQDVGTTSNDVLDGNAVDEDEMFLLAIQASLQENAGNGQQDLESDVSSEFFPTNEDMLDSESDVSSEFFPTLEDSSVHARIIANPTDGESAVLQNLMSEEASPQNVETNVTFFVKTGSTSQEVAPSLESLTIQGRLSNEPRGWPLQRVLKQGKRKRRA
jgi:hypothetical protein